MNLNDLIRTELRAAWAASDERQGHRFLGPNLGRIRKASGLSQNQLARIIDPSGKLRYTTVARWERGDNSPTPRRIPRLIEVAVALVRITEPERNISDAELEAELTGAEWSPGA